MSSKQQEAEIVEALECLRASFYAGKSKPLQWRLQQLQGVEKMVSQNETLFQQALATDLGRHPFEAVGLELLGLQTELRHIIENLRSWMRPEFVPVPLVMAPATTEIVRDPFGVCLLLGPFNYPVMLMLSPMVGAIAAGNCVMMKPSEMCGAVEKLLLQLVPKYLDNDCIRIVSGAVDTTSFLLKQRWDKIFFTGSPRVGRIVMKAAAEHLTPVCLELGGKSPTIIDKNSPNMELVAQRILWGKCANAGQTCIAPDYIFCHEQQYDAFLAVAKRTLLRFYGSDPQQAADFGRVVTTAHCERLKSLIDECGSSCIAVGGKVDVKNKYVEPTILIGVSKSSKVMTEEIFGPVLPVLKYSDLDSEVIAHIKSGEKPLTMYIFSKDRTVIDKLTSEVSSGTVLVNDTLFHFANHFAPFGGVGNSGLGGYHGKFSFDAFTFQRTIMRRDDHLLLDIPLRYPPYSDFALKVFKTVGSLPFTQPHISAASVMRTFLWAASVVGCAVAITHFAK